MLCSSSLFMQELCRFRLSPCTLLTTPRWVPSSTILRTSGAQCFSGGGVPGPSFGFIPQLPAPLPWARLQDGLVGGSPPGMSNRSSPNGGFPHPSCAVRCAVFLIRSAVCRFVAAGIRPLSRRFTLSSPFHQRSLSFSFWSEWFW